MEGQRHTEREPSAFRMIATLGVAGFLAGVILVSIFQWTKPMIEQHRADALEAAIFEVLAGAHSYATLRVEGESLAIVDGETDQQTIYAGKDSTGALIGFAIPNEATGYQDIISVLFGYDPIDKKVVGMEVLESKETPGLGDKIYKDDDFVQQFADLAVAQGIKAVKPGEKTADNQVITITGATISSATVVDIINKGLAEWQTRIDNYLAESETMAQNEAL